MGFSVGAERAGMPLDTLFKLSILIPKIRMAKTLILSKHSG